MGPVLVECSLAGPAPRRVVVTGLGAVTPLGASVEATLAALGRGESAPAPARIFDASAFPEPRAAEVTAFDARAHFRLTKALKLADRKARFAVAAASMALADAGFPEGEAEREGLGVVLGSSGSDLQAAELAHAFRRESEPHPATDVRRFAERILSGLNPLWLLVNLPNMASAHVAIQLQARGPNSTVMTDLSAGAQAIGEAADWIRSGEADAVLAGGADTGLFSFAYASYEQAGVLGPGFVPGEGAAVLLLEERERARGRGARIWGELLSYGSSSSKDRQGALLASLRLALEGTPPGFRADLVGLASAFPTEEAAALVDAAGERSLARVTRFTDRLGHTLAAAAPTEAALLLASAPPRAGILCSSLGVTGPAASLAFRAGDGEEGT